MQASGTQTTPPDARVNVYCVDHGKPDIALKYVMAIATKARTTACRNARAPYLSVTWLYQTNDRQQGDSF
jgi:hypothetical protein